MSQTANLKKPKKLIVCCDGTWQNRDSGWVKGTFKEPNGHMAIPTNVTRITRAIKPLDQNEHPQVVYYQAGVGTGFSIVDHVLGGGTGEGLSENIREAYGFMSDNYTEGDSLFLVGFSRGAFTARSIGGLIGGIGLLNKHAMEYFYAIFKDWENAGKEGYTPWISKQIPSFKIDPPRSSEVPDIQEYLSRYRSKLVHLRLTREVKITAIGVWDTVGALGIPTTPWLQAIGLPDFIHEYKFLDTTLGNHIEHAFHGLALDEQRASFAPTLWSKPPGCTTQLKQVWFPGVHSNVGGAYEDMSTSDVTLAWMMSQLRPWIEFYPNYMRDEHLKNVAWYKQHPPAHMWGSGRVYNSLEGITALGGKKARTPKQYYRTDYWSGKQTDEPLRETNESMHMSVRARQMLGGFNIDQKTRYSPDSLKGWNYTPVAGSQNDGFARHTKNDSVVTSEEIFSAGDAEHQKGWRWVNQEEGKEMLEDDLGFFELQLLEADPEVAVKILGGKPDQSRFRVGDE